MSEYFKLEELLRSSTALKNQIENLPSWDVVQHLGKLAEFLDGLRDAWGGPITVSSGFRSTDLNAEVKGVQRSAHKIGYAADLVPKNGNMEKFKKTVVNWIQDKKFDQCLLEESGNSQWVHISLYSQDGQQRCEIKKLIV